MADAKATGKLQGKSVELDLNVEDGAPDEVGIILRLKYGSNEDHRLVFVVSYAGPNPTLSTQALSISGAAICLASCGLGSASGPITACIKKSATITDFKNCIKANGITIVAGTLTCVLQCLLGGASGGGAPH